jgi:hypothetical protein
MKLLRFALIAALLASCAPAHAGDFTTPGNRSTRAFQKLNELFVQGELSMGEDGEIYANGGIAFDDDQEHEIYYDDEDDEMFFEQQENGEASWTFRVRELQDLYDAGGVELALSDERAKLHLETVNGVEAEFRLDNDEGELTITNESYMLAVRDTVAGTAQIKIGTADVGGPGQGVVIGNSDDFPGHGNLSLDTDGTAGQIRITEDDINGSNYFALVGPSALAGNVTCTIDASGLIPSSCIAGGGGGLDNVVEDLSPQLGGDLDLNNFDITTTDNAATITLGTTGGGSSATPTQINMGGSYADSAVASKAKWIMWTDGVSANSYAIGITSARFNFFTDNTASYNWLFDDVDEMRLDTSALYPTTDAGLDLGTSSLGWNDLHFGADGVINFDGGDVLITHAANDLAFTGVTGDYSFDDTVGVTGSVTASVNVTATAGDVTSGDDVIVGDDVLMPNGGTVGWNSNEVNITHTGSDTISVQGGSFGFHQDSDTIVSGAIGYSRSYVVVDTEGAAATDDLITMTAAPIGGVPKWIQAANDARTVVIKGDSSGNIVSSNGGDCILDDAEDMAMLMYNSTLTEWVIVSCSQSQAEHIAVAASDETTAITAAAGKIKFRMPYAFNVDSVRCSLSTAQNTTGAGTIFTVDINEGDADLDGGNPVSILSTKVTIDDDETTSMTAATAPVLSDVVLAADAEMSIDVDAIGASADAAGLKCSIIGHQ